MRPNSLALRLFFSATTWSVLVLLVVGFMLSVLYRSAVERSFDRRLGGYLRSIVGDVASPDQPGKFPQSLTAPAFDLPLSGWYWQVTRLDAPVPVVRSSRSLWDGMLPRLADLAGSMAAGSLRVGNAEGPEGRQLRILERTIDLGGEGRFVVAVAGDTEEIEGDIHSFDTYLLMIFGAMALALLLITMFQVRFGLAPLKRISDGLSAIRSGRAERLEGAFPVEIAPLARETNALIDANREIVMRARTHAGNLAHALKTPLSVMMNEASAHSGEPLALKVREQTEIMRDQVARHLERARLAARVAVVGTVIEVRPILTALARTMEKIYHRRGIAIALDATEGARFRGEQQDLEEMVGNLVDNACKWAQSRVAIEVFSEKPDAADERRVVRIVVDDDGPGLSPQQREQVTRRGRRLDETKPGSGLGLSIVLELAALYGGALTLGTAPIGGLRAELMLPGV